MSTNKNFDKICCIILAFCIVLATMMYSADGFLTHAVSANHYSERFFDDSYVHSINIIVNPTSWDNMIANAADKEYISCTLDIDGVVFSNIGIRAKGNSSLQQVQSSDSDRYSFKIEFDQYDSKSYFGLDKLTLNNIIQDKTFMKDYLAYKLMGEFGVPSPLVSFTEVLLNGESWGFYLGVEAIEEGFLQRNYGNNYGIAYKPETSGGAGGGGGAGGMPEGMADMMGDIDPDALMNVMQNISQDEIISIIASTLGVPPNEISFDRISSLISALDEETLKSLMDSIMSLETPQAQGGMAQGEMAQQGGMQAPTGEMTAPQGEMAQQGQMQAPTGEMTAPQGEQSAPMMGEQAQAQGGQMAQGEQSAPMMGEQAQAQGGQMAQGEQSAPMMGEQAQAQAQGGQMAQGEMAQQGGMQAPTGEMTAPQGEMAQQGGMQAPTGEMTEPQGEMAQQGGMQAPTGEMTAPQGENNLPLGEMAQQGQQSQGQGDRNQQGGGMQGGGMMGGMGSSISSALEYVDDNADSYAYIFDNAVNNISNNDKNRLISSLKQLSDQENLDKILDVESVLRYFVVHSFLLNYDSYTGAIMHNYYLYEDGGVLSMLPWDYNLSFVDFMNGGYNTQELINFPIDTPVSTGSMEDRPMLSWIFSSDEYTQQYHDIYSEFIEEMYTSNYMVDLINSTDQMINEYVKADETKFFTYENYQNGVTALLEVIALRCDSIIGQLNGTIPSTADGQTANPSNLIQTGSLEITDTGSTDSGQGGGGGGGDRGEMTQGGNRGEMAQGGMAQGEMAQGEMAQGGMAQGEMAQPQGEQAIPGADSSPMMGEQAQSNQGQQSDRNQMAQGGQGGMQGNMPGGDRGGTITAVTTVADVSGTILICIGFLLLVLIILRFYHKRSI